MHRRQQWRVRRGRSGLGPVVPSHCYSPVTYWHDKVHNTHLSNEFRVSTPSDWRLRGVAGVFYEQFRINDVMNFEYKTIPSCDQPGAIAAQNPAAGHRLRRQRPACASAPQLSNPSVRDDMTGYGEDIYRGFDQTALFVHADFDIIPNVLTVSGGTRHFDYDEFEKGSVYHTATNCTGILVCPAKANIDAEHLAKAYTGFKSQFELQYHPTKNLNFYYLYSEGFRPGGFNRYSGNQGTVHGRRQRQPVRQECQLPTRLPEEQRGRREERAFRSPPAA